MGTTAYPGPLSVGGIEPSRTGPTPYVGGGAARRGENPDAAASLFWAGIGLRDPDYLAQIGSGANIAGGYPNQDCGWYGAGKITVVDYAPRALGANLLALVQNVVIAAPLTLTAGVGMALLAAPYTVLPTGNVIPAGSISIDGNATWLGSGQSGAFKFYNPLTGLSRSISMTGVGAGAGGNFLVSGYDVYGAPTSELLTVAAGVNTVNTAKTFKWLRSVTPQFTDAQDYSVGVGDVFGFPLRVDQWDQVEIYWDGALVTVSTGFVAADATSPATTTTNDVRGSYVSQTASDATRRLVMKVTPALANVIGATNAAMRIGLKGVPQV